MQLCHSDPEARSGRLDLPADAAGFTSPRMRLAVDGARVHRALRLLGTGLAVVALVACGGRQQTPEGREQARLNAERARQQSIETALGNSTDASTPIATRETIWDLFGAGSDPERMIGVNRYLWAASLDILSFLPLEGADPFSGVIATNWGRVGGDATPFRVTVLISEPALDARSLKVAAFRQQGGRAVPVSAADNRALEDAILTRARQLRIAAERG